MFNKFRDYDYNQRHGWKIVVLLIIVFYLLLWGRQIVQGAVTSNLGLWKRVGDQIRNINTAYDTLTISDGTDSVMIIGPGEIIGTKDYISLRNDTIFFGDSTTFGCFDIRAKDSTGHIMILRFNFTDSTIEYSNNGVNFSDVGSGGGGGAWNWKDSANYGPDTTGNAKQARNADSLGHSAAAAYLLRGHFDDSLNNHPEIGNYIDTTTLDTIANAYLAVRARDADSLDGVAPEDYMLRGHFDDSLNNHPEIGNYIDTTTLDTIYIAHRAVGDASGNAIASTYETITNVAKIGDDTATFKNVASHFDTDYVSLTVASQVIDDDTSIVSEGELEDSLDGYSTTTTIAATYETITNVALIGDDTAHTKEAYDSVNAWNDVRNDIDAIGDDTTDYQDAYDSSQVLDARLATKADTSIDVIAGNGMTGGGNLQTDRTLNVVAGVGLTVAADSVYGDTNTLATKQFVRDSGSVGGGFNWQDSAGEPPYWVDSAKYADYSDSANKITDGAVHYTDLDDPTKDSISAQSSYGRNFDVYGDLYATGRIIQHNKMPERYFAMVGDLPEDYLNISAPASSISDSSTDLFKMLHFWPSFWPQGHGVDSGDTLRAYNRAGDICTLIAKEDNKVRYTAIGTPPQEVAEDPTSRVSNYPDREWHRMYGIGYRTDDSVIDSVDGNTQDGGLKDEGEGVFSWSNTDVSMGIGSIGSVPFYKGTKSILIFDNVKFPRLPAGDGVDSAFVKVRSHTTNALTGIELKLFMEDTGSSVAAVSDTTDFNARNKTPDSVTWSISASWTAGQWYRTPNIGTLVDSVLMRADYSSGNDIALLILDNGSSNGKSKSITCYDNNANHSAVLIIYKDSLIDTVYSRDPIFAADDYDTVHSCSDACDFVTADGERGILWRIGIDTGQDEQYERVTLAVMTTPNSIDFSGGWTVLFDDTNMAAGESKTSWNMMAPGVNYINGEYNIKFVDLTTATAGRIISCWAADIDSIWYDYLNGGAQRTDLRVDTTVFVPMEYEWLDYYYHVWHCSYGYEMDNDQYYCLCAMDTASDTLRAYDRDVLVWFWSYDDKTYYPLEFPIMKTHDHAQKTYPECGFLYLSRALQIGRDKWGLWISGEDSVTSGEGYHTSYTELYVLNDTGRWRLEKVHGIGYDHENVDLKVPYYDGTTDYLLMDTCITGTDISVPFDLTIKLDEYAIIRSLFYVYKASDSGFIDSVELLLHTWDTLFMDTLYDTMLHSWKLLGDTFIDTIARANYSYIADSVYQSDATNRTSTSLAGVRWTFDPPFLVRPNEPVKIRFHDHLERTPGFVAIQDAWLEGWKQ